MSRKLILLAILIVVRAQGADMSQGQNSNSVVWCEQCKAYISTKGQKTAAPDPSAPTVPAATGKAKKGE